MIFGHGGDSYQYSKEILADFSSNIWAEASIDELKNVINLVFNKIRTYPHPSGESLNRIIANNFAIKQEMILPVNGATEAIYLIAQAYKNSVSCVFYPGFSEYEDACKINGHDVHLYHYDEFDVFDDYPGGLTFIANPNNPDGRVITKRKIEELLSTFKYSLFIIDESLIDFSPRAVTAVNLLNDFDNLIIIRSLSHQYGIPGLRLGYILSNPDIIAKIQDIKAPWTINSLALEAGKYFLTHTQKYAVPIKKVMENKQKLVDSINQLPEFEVQPSDSSFFLVKMKKGNSQQLKNYLANFFHILVRDASNFKGLNDKYIRLSTLGLNKNLLLIKALKEWSDSLK